LALRPSSDRLRETLFNVLGSSVEDSVFVDLFAGSGAVGIEALSRGARRAIFVENHAAAVRLLRSNLESLGIPVAAAKASALPGRRKLILHSGIRPKFSGAAEIIAVDAIAGLEQLASTGTEADIVFADPPWARAAAYTAVLDWLGNCDLLDVNGLVILEHSSRRTLPALAGRLERFRLLEQGDAALSFYRVVLAA
jgi:16S rRNA (guanine(966)-N(2))-methyltransferase RsmD